jgi:hypothetical protein
VYRCIKTQEGYVRVKPRGNEDIRVHKPDEKRVHRDPKESIYGCINPGEMCGCVEPKGEGI